jgi:hypothetical protein
VGCDPGVVMVRNAVIIWNMPGKNEYLGWKFVGEWMRKVNVLSVKGYLKTNGIE